MAASDATAGASSSRSSGKGKAATISLTELLEAAGEDNAESVRSLVLRRKGLTNLAEHTPKLVQLELLSLSNNQFAALDGFCHLRSLSEVNLNNNQLASLDGLQGAANTLRKVFASGNQIADVAPLAACTKLVTLSIMRNAIPTIPPLIQALANCSQLSELDLAGNPCADTLDGSWRGEVAAGLAWLDQLDGDPLEHQSQQDGGTPEDDSTETLGRAPPPPPPQRPTTPPALHTQTTPHHHQIRPSTAPVHRRPTIAGGGSRIFRSEFLNDHPILLEYLAAETCALDAQSNKEQRPTRFVSRLRGLAADMSSESEETPEEMATRLAAQAASAAATAELEEHALAPGVHPMESIRRLLLVVQKLRLERDEALEAARLAASEADRLRLQRGNNGFGVKVDAAAPPSTPGGVVLPSEAAELAKAADALVKENATLRRENMNMWMIVDENKDLRRRIGELEHK